MNIFPFQKLPKDMHLIIFHQLSIEDQVNLGKTCKYYREFCRTITNIPKKYHAKLTNTSLQFYTNLEKLYLHALSPITDDGVQYLTNLKELYFEKYVTKYTGLMALMDYTYYDLKLMGGPHITDAGMQYLTNLTILELGYNRFITNVGIQHLTNLTTLHLGWNNYSTITNAGIQHLTNLTKLDLGYNNNISNESVQYLR